MGILRRGFYKIFECLPYVWGEKVAPDHDRSDTVIVTRYICFLKNRGIFLCHLLVEKKVVL